MAKYLADSFDKIAEVIHILYIYGCFSNKDFDDSEIRKKINDFVINSESAYRKVKDYLVHIFEDVIENKREGLIKHNYISKDRFNANMAKMAGLYRLGSDKQVAKSVYGYVEHMNALCNDKKSKKQRVKEYLGADAHRDSLFFMNIGESKFSRDEFIQIYNAIMFYSGKAPFSVPGFFTCDRINDYLKLSGQNGISDETTPVFEYNSIDRIINDNSVCTIFEAIKNKKYVSFISRKKEVETLLNTEKRKKASSNDKFLSGHMEVYPLKIMYEFRSGRGYLIFWQETIRICRLDYIYETKVIDKTPDTDELVQINKRLDNVLERLWLSDNSGARKRVVVDFDERAEDFKKYVPIGNVIKTARRKCRYEAELLNFKDIVPFIREFGNKAHISTDESRFLYDYVKKDIEEALKKYGAL